MFASQKKQIVKDFLAIKGLNKRSQQAIESALEKDILA